MLVNFRCFTALGTMLVSTLRLEHLAVNATHMPVVDLGLMLLSAFDGLGRLYPITSKSYVSSIVPLLPTGPLTQQ
jgi:hypothetical protein